MTRLPEPGHVLIVDGRASVQFAGPRKLLFRVISVCEKSTYHGWVWLTGYVLDRAGQATDKREIFVQVDGLCRVPATPRPQARRTDRGAIVNTCG